MNELRPEDMSRGRADRVWCEERLYSASDDERLGRAWLCGCGEPARRICSGGM